MINVLHPAVLELIQGGLQRGFITFDELNALLPDEYVDPDKIDELLAQFLREEIRLIDNISVPQEYKPKIIRPDIIELDSVSEEEAEVQTDDEGETLLTPEQAKAEFAQALQGRGQQAYRRPGPHVPDADG